MQLNLHLSNRQEPLRKKCAELLSDATPLIFLVPEATSLEMQRTLLAKSPDASLVHAEVLSFNRLAHRVFEETGSPAANILDDMGKSLLLYRVANENKDELVYYKDSVAKSGFIGQLKLFITEMYQYKLPLEGPQFKGNISGKWHDLTLLYNKFAEALSEDTICSEQLLDYLAEAVDRSAFLKRARVCFYAYSGFTPQQYRVITALLHNCVSLDFCFMLSEEMYSKHKNSQSFRDFNADAAPGQFKSVMGTILRLEDLARDLKAPIKSVENFMPWPEETEERTREALRNGLFQPYSHTLQPEEREKQQTAYYEAFSSKEEEIKALMHQILGLVREEGYRFSDIAVLCPNPEEYAHALRRAFVSYDFSFYIQEKTPFIQHSLSRFILQGTELMLKDYTRESFMSFLRSGLVCLPDDCLDRIENEAVKCGLNTRTELLNLMSVLDDEQGTKLSRALINYQNELYQAGNICEYCAALDCFLAESGMKEVLNTQIEKLDGAAYGTMLMRHADEYRKLWEAYTIVKERMEAVLGDMNASETEFYNILVLAYRQLMVATIPTNMDQVLVGGIRTTKLPKLKAVFFIGMSESFPGDGDNPGLFTRSERAYLNEQMEMEPNNADVIGAVFYNCYEHISAARERVYFSYAASGTDGKPIEAMPYWSNLERLARAGWPRYTEYTLPYPYLQEEGLAARPEILRLLEKQKPKLSSLLKKAKKEFGEKESLSKELMLALISARSGSVKPIYSISQLERFNNCPFDFFLRYAIALCDREEPSVDALSNGTVLHAIMEENAALFRQMWSGAMPDEKGIQADVERMMNKALTQEDNRVYASTGRYRFYWHKLQEAAKKAVLEVCRQLQNGSFRPEKFEYEFGNKNEPYTLRYNGEEILLQGKIDRLDILDRGEDKYVRIIDYKSGNKLFSEKDMEKGLQIQLPIYMEAAMERFGAKPGAMLYFHLVPKDASYKMSGLVLKDRGIVEANDENLAEGEASDIIPVKLKKDGDFDANSKVLDEKEWNALNDHLNQGVWESIRELETGCISKGRRGERPECKYCDYREACNGYIQLSEE